MRRKPNEHSCSYQRKFGILPDIYNKKDKLHFIKQSLEDMVKSEMEK
jgi:hypothetical protein